MLKDARRRTGTIAAAYCYNACRTVGRSARVWPRVTSIPATSRKWLWRTRWDIISASVPFGHSGFQNIMFSLPAGNNLWDWGLFGFYLNAEPYFTSVDKRNVWRFIVDQLRDEL